MIRNIIGCLIALIVFSCQNEIQPKKLKVGTYRAVLEMQDNEELPFVFEVKSPTELKVFNAEEVINVDEIEYRNDSILIS